MAIAIVAHELPQELGDFSLLLKAGWTAKRALLANFAVSLTSIVGMCVALSVGEEFESSTNYLIPFAAGLFLYLALADIIPELTCLPTHLLVRAAVVGAVGIGLVAAAGTIGGGHSHEGSDGGGHAH